MTRRRFRAWLVPCLLLGLLATFAVSSALATWKSTADAKFASESPVGSFGRPLAVVWIERSWTFGTERRTVGWWPLNGFPRGWRFPGFPHLPRDREVEDAPVRTTRWGVLSHLSWEQVAAQHDGAEEARGWPMLAFWWWAEPSPNPRGYTIHGGIELTPRLGGSSPYAAESRAIPWLPIWPGLIMNTLFYAVIWLTLFAALASTRAALRRRAGLCPRCNYDLSGAPQLGCPECGWRRAGETTAS